MQFHFYSLTMKMLTEMSMNMDMENDTSQDCLCDIYQPNYTIIYPCEGLKQSSGIQYLYLYVACAVFVLFLAGGVIVVAQRKRHRNGIV